MRTGVFNSDEVYGATSFIEHVYANWGSQVNFEAQGTTLEQASAKAKAENKLIFMWYSDNLMSDIDLMVRNMPWDMFTDPKLGDFMNSRFVSIVVDGKSTYGTQLKEKDVVSNNVFYIFNASGLEMDSFRSDADKVGANSFIKYVSQVISRKIVYCNSPSEEGFQLVKTSTIDGVKCEHYEKNGLKVRTFTKDNGDFITIKEDEYGFDRISENNINPYVSDPSCESPTFLSFPSRFSAKSGIICTREKVEGYNEGKYQTAFPDGSYVESTNKLAYFPETWQIFKSGDINITNYSGDSLHIDRLNKNYPIVDIRRFGSSTKYKDDLYGVIVNDRFCTLFPDGTISKPFLQKFGNHYYFVNATDTIVDVVIQADTIYNRIDHSITQINYLGATLKYTNGDWVKIDLHNQDRYDLSRQNLQSGIIHRNGGIWEIGNHTLKLPDGRVFKGEFLDRNGSYSYEQEASSLSFDTLTYYFGSMMLPPDGRIVKYSFGQTEEERKREAEKNRQQKEVVEKAIYNQLCNKFGKKYVDAALAGTPIVGMPEQLFVATFKPELSQEYADSRCYHVRGWSLRNGSSRMTLTNKALKYSVWVTNGKVSSISTW